MAQPKVCTLEMADYISGLQKSTNARKLTTAWKAMLLANPASRLADVVSNTIMAGMETVKSLPASAIDRAVSARTGIRTRMFSTDDIGRASWEAVRQAPKDMGQAMRGIDTFQGGNRALDTYQGEVQYNTPLLGAIVNTVFRTVSAADRPFKRFAFDRSLREQARIMGTQAGYRGAELEDFILRTLPVMPDENVMRAFHDAHVATFSDMTPVAAALVGAKAGLARAGGGGGEVIGDIVFPFAKVPSNVAHRTLEYSPAGLVMGFMNLRKAFRLATNGDVSEAAKFQQFAVDQLGRSSTGLAAIMAGWWLAERNLLSLKYPEKEGERGRWEATGQQEYAVRIGNRWLSIKKLAPWGPLMMLGGFAQRSDKIGDDAYWRAYEDARAQGLDAVAAREAALEAQAAARAEDSGGMASGLLTGLLNTTMDQPALTGMQQFQEMEKEGSGGFARWTERMAASLIPPLISRWATVVDPVVRETRGGDGLSSILAGRMPDALQAKIPFASRSLPARHDVLGDAVPKEGSFFLNFLDPFNSRLDRSTQEDVRRELDRLQVSTSRITRGSDDRETFYRRREAYGIMLYGVLADVIASDEYQGIAEARRWAARNIPGIRQSGVEARIQAEQRAFLQAAIRDVRGYWSRERKKGSFTGEGNLPTPEETQWGIEDGIDRTLDSAWERAGEIDEEEVGVPDDGA
jgi:uncharacterized protein (DUF2384 family)